MRFAFALTLVLLAAPSLAESQCVSKDAGADLLQGFGEHLIFQGQTAHGTIFKLYASPDLGTWTVMEDINGLFCLRVFGRKWEPGSKSTPKEET